MRTGPRFRISRNGDGYRTESHSATIVRVNDHLYLLLSNRITGKKLKKRLEDLERRAGSSSASPEQQPAELAKVERAHTKAIPIQDTRRNQPSRNRTPDVLAQQYLLPTDDRSMFSQQFTRQLSTSPPPFTYASLPMTESYSFPQSNNFCNVPQAMDQSSYAQYVPPLQQQYQSSVSQPLKSEFYGDDEMSPFSMSYASIGSVDVSAAQSYQDLAPYVSTRHREYRQ